MQSSEGLPTPGTVVQPADELARVAASFAASALPSVEGYELLARIGEGGMGVVYRARDLRLGRLVAVKLIRPELAGQPELVTRFEREAAIAARLPHPNIPPVHALERLPDGRPLMVMKLVQGRTWDDLLASGRPPLDELPQCLQVFSQVCNAVAFAHAEGIIHRDLKPANVMVGRFGEVQVMDWGLAKVVGGEAADAPFPGAAPAGLTQPGILGTPGFMAPEQARGEVGTLGPPTDVFALGAILCAILTGAPPFIGPPLNVVARCAAGRTGEADRRLAWSGAPAELVALARRCLSPAPADRPADAGAVAEAVRAYIEDAQKRERAHERREAIYRDRLMFAGRGLTARRVLGGAVVVLLFGAGVALAATGGDEAKIGAVMLMAPAITLVLLGGYFVLLEVFTSRSVFLQAISGGRSRSAVGAGGVKIPKGNPLGGRGDEPTAPLERPVRRPYSPPRPDDGLRRALTTGPWVLIGAAVLGVLGYGAVNGFRDPDLRTAPEPEQRRPAPPLPSANVRPTLHVSPVRPSFLTEVSRLVRHHEATGFPDRYADGISGARLDRVGRTWQVVYTTHQAELAPATRERFRTLPDELSVQVFHDSPVEVRVEQMGLLVPKRVETFSTTDEERP